MTRPSARAYSRYHKRLDARFKLAIRDQTESAEGEFALVSESPLVVEGEIEIDRVAFGVGTAKRWWDPVTPGDQATVHFRTTLE